MLRVYTYDRMRTLVFGFAFVQKGLGLGCLETQNKKPCVPLSKSGSQTWELSRKCLMPGGVTGTLAKKEMAATVLCHL